MRKILRTKRGWSKYEIVLVIILAAIFAGMMVYFLYGMVKWMPFEYIS